MDFIIVTIRYTQVIELSFDRFNLDPKQQHVRVRNGAKTSARLLVFHTGSSAPPTVQSTANVLRLEFEHLVDDDEAAAVVVEAAVGKKEAAGSSGKGFVARYVTLGRCFLCTPQDNSHENKSGLIQFILYTASK